MSNYPQMLLAVLVVGCWWQPPTGASSCVGGTSSRGFTANLKGFTCIQVHALCVTNAIVQIPAPAWQLTLSSNVNRGAQQLIDKEWKWTSSPSQERLSMLMGKEEGELHYCLLP